MENKCATPVVKSYSQNGEDALMWGLATGHMKLQGIENFKGNILDIGANDGKTLSNSLLFIENGWSAVCVEPAPRAYERLNELHKGRPNVYTQMVAISNYNGISDFYDSGAHLGCQDVSLLSTLNESELERWQKSTLFTRTEVQVMDFGSFMSRCPTNKFHVISIDCEGEDFVILQQINLFATETIVICIEWNGKDFENYDSWLQQNWEGCKLWQKNAENLIYYQPNYKP